MHLGAMKVGAKDGSSKKPRTDTEAQLVAKSESSSSSGDVSSIE